MTQLVLPVCHVRLAPEGSGSLMTTPLAWPLPLFVRTMVKVAVWPAEIVPLVGVLAMMRLGAVTMTVLVPVASPVRPEVCPCSVARASCDVFIGGEGGLEFFVGSFSTWKLMTMRQ